MGLRALVVLVLVFAGCANHEADPITDAIAFVSNAQARRDAMELSTGAADTPYGTIRREHYALDGVASGGAADWDALPVFAPRVRRLCVADGPSCPSLDEGPVVDPPAYDLASLRRAGARAFERYPLQIDLALEIVRDSAEARRAGLLVGSDGIVHGVVEVETPSGWVVALTCAGCHAAMRDGVWLPGVANEQLAMGYVEQQAAWSPGTMDVTADEIDAPVRPSDLRPIALEHRLHHTGNLYNGRLARMVRIETLAITQLGARARPDRVLVTALALYLEQLAETLPSPDPAAPAAATFERVCARCHGRDLTGGAWVPVDDVATDGLATEGGERGTGGYRPPSLLGIADRRSVLHDGSASDLRAVLRLRPSAHRGHAFGLELSIEERVALADWLEVRR